MSIILMNQVFNLSTSTMKDVKYLKLPSYPAENGELVVMEGVSDVPFSIARVFVVRASKGDVRGEHAHKLCSQLLICSSGKIDVSIDDGHEISKFSLDRPDIGLFLPPGIWAVENYLEDNSVLVVLCDRPYELNDYIREYDLFKEYRSQVQ